MSLEETSAERVERTANAGGETRSALFGDDLEVSYAAADEPVVTCDRVDIPEGEITAFVGPNGSGKSTLLKALSKHLAPDEGAVVLDGKDIQEYGQKELARELGLLSQENTSPGSITVEDLVYHGRYPHRGFFDSVTDEDREAVERAIDLAGVEWRHVRPALPWSTAATGLALGEQTARSLGMAVERTRFLLAGVAVLAAAASISIAGIVGFVGLLIPHVVRNIVGSDYKRLMVGCLFAGPALMVAADVIARLALPVGQIPVGIVTGALGGPYFLYLMHRQQDVGEL